VKKSSASAFIRSFRVVRIVLLALGMTTAASAQLLPNPYRIVDGWAKLPDGRTMGAVGKVDVAPDGTHIWAVVRCEPLYDQARFGDECREFEDQFDLLVRITTATSSGVLAAACSSGRMASTSIRMGTSGSPMR
jgi:hypothetical protein